MRLEVEERKKGSHSTDWQINLPFAVCLSDNAISIQQSREVVGATETTFFGIVNLKMGILCACIIWGACDSAKNHKRQRRKRQSVTAKREKSQTPKFL